MRNVAVAVLLLPLITCQGQASKERLNFTYVKSGPDGVFYARCVPTEDKGTRGTTKVYFVNKDKDTLQDSYNWYTKNGVVLSWSPIAGKVAIMALGDDSSAKGPHTLTFYLGGKELTSYSSQDLKAWGADIWQRGGRGAIFTVLGEEQIPGTNEYVFSIAIKGKKLSFDILTGKLYKQQPAMSSPAEGKLPK